MYIYIYICVDYIFLITYSFTCLFRTYSINMFDSLEILKKSKVGGPGGRLLGSAGAGLHGPKRCAAASRKKRRSSAWAFFGRRGLVSGFTLQGLRFMAFAFFVGVWGWVFRFEAYRNLAATSSIFVRARLERAGGRCAARGLGSSSMKLHLFLGSSRKKLATIRAQYLHDHHASGISGGWKWREPQQRSECSILLGRSQGNLEPKGLPDI